MRLNQYIASCGVCSRREADRLIQAGEVMVDGRPASPGMRLEGAETVTVRGKKLIPVREPVVVAWYKPAGVTCTARDGHAEKTITDVFRYPVRLTYAGRLDRDSEGLLLMTNDGPLIDAMMRGANGHEKEYLVRVRRRISDAELHRLSTGIYLRELEQKTRPCRVERLGERTFRIVLTQGLNRQIRRMCRTLGHEIRFLKRVRVLNIELGDLKPGQQRKITGRELEELYALAAGDERAPSGRGEKAETAKPPRAGGNGNAPSGRGEKAEAAKPPRAGGNGNGRGRNSRESRQKSRDGHSHE